MLLSLILHGWWPTITCGAVTVGRTVLASPILLLTTLVKAIRLHHGPLIVLGLSITSPVGITLVVRLRLLLLIAWMEVCSRVLLLLPERCQWAPSLLLCSIIIELALRWLLTLAVTVTMRLLIRLFPAH